MGEAECMRGLADLFLNSPLIWVRGRKEEKGKEDPRVIKGFGTPEVAVKTAREGQAFLIFTVHLNTTNKFEFVGL